MALYDDEDVSYSDEGEDEFTELASELLPDADPEKLKRLIQICVEEDRKEREMEGEGESMGMGRGPKGGGSMLVLELGGGKPPKK